MTVFQYHYSSILYCHTAEKLQHDRVEQHSVYYMMHYIQMTIYQLFHHSQLYAPLPLVPSLSIVYTHHLSMQQNKMLHKYREQSNTYNMAYR